MPYLYKEKELEIRSLLGKQLVRGKIDLSINIEQSSVDSVPELNKDLAIKYFDQFKELSKELNIEVPADPFSILMKMPEILTSSKEELKKEEWEDLLQGIKNTITKVDEFRSQEGSHLNIDFVQRINEIQNLLTQVESFEEARVPRIKERINANLKTFVEDLSNDKNRLEQEMIFYLEKLDVTEEKVRLAKHCDYFLETLNNEENAGKKLGFITQEIGREINTLGSKANDADIQKIVVLMKDNLEKIKEQLFNIL